MRSTSGAGRRATTQRYIILAALWIIAILLSTQMFLMRDEIRGDLNDIKRELGFQVEEGRR